MEIQDIRRSNLKKLIEQKYEGKQSKLLAASKQNQGEISGLLSGKRVFGEKKARALELELGLAKGFFDKEESHAYPQGLTDEHRKMLKIIDRLDSETRVAFVGLFETLVPERRKKNIGNDPMRRLDDKTYGAEDLSDTYDKPGQDEQIKRRKAE